MMVCRELASNSEFSEVGGCLKAGKRIEIFIRDCSYLKIAVQALVHHITEQHTAIAIYDCGGLGMGGGQKGCQNSFANLTDFL